jgi:hypothetical protein
MLLDHPINQRYEGRDLREVQVDAVGLYSHSCTESVAGSVTHLKLKWGFANANCFLAVKHFDENKLKSIV